MSITSSYMQLPTFLFTTAPYSALSIEAKMLYALLLDRHRLSTKNKEKFSDENGIFVVFTREKMAAMLNCCHKKSSLLMKELRLVKLVKEKRAGLNKANRIYVHHPYEELQERIVDVQSEIQPVDLPRETSSYPDESILTVQDTQNLHPNQTNNNQTEVISIYQGSTNQKPKQKTKMPSSQEMDDTSTQKREYIKKQIGYSELYSSGNEKRKKLLDVILELLLQVESASPSQTFVVNRYKNTAKNLRDMFGALDRKCIEYVCDCVEEQGNIRNIKSYLLTTLYNAPGTVCFYQPGKPKEEYCAHSYTLSALHHSGERIIRPGDLSYLMDTLD